MTEETASLAPETEASEEVIADTEAKEATPQTDTDDGQGVDDESHKPDDSDAQEEAKTRNQLKREAKKERQRREREELEKLQAQKAALEAAKTEQPKEDNFDDYDDYRAAKAVWMYAQSQSDAKSAQISAQEQALEQERQRQISIDFYNQVEEAKTRYDNFEDVVRFAPITDEVAHMVAESDVGADLAYFLGSNPAIAREISGLSPIHAARELGRIESRLTAPQPKTKTAAPAPISPVNGGINASEDPTTMKPSRYNEWRENGGTFKIGN